MYFHIIASGSKGNATLVATNKTRILIDMGISLCRLEEGLAEINLKKEDIDACFFTHDHTDHIGGIKFLSPKKMYALEGTLPTTLSNVIVEYVPVTIGEFTITAFKTSHDATNPCGYKLESNGETLVYMTDTGVFLEENLPLIKNPNYLIIECNHDISMLLKTDRPFQLKERILSDHGHLCNEDSAVAAISIIGDKTKEIVLAHISEEANTPEIALDAYKKVFAHFGVRFATRILYLSNLTPKWAKTFLYASRAISGVFASSEIWALIHYDLPHQC